MQERGLVTHVKRFWDQPWSRRFLNLSAYTQSNHDTGQQFFLGSFQTKELIRQNAQCHCRPALRFTLPTHVQLGSLDCSAISEGCFCLVGYDNHVLRLVARLCPVVFPTWAANRWASSRAGSIANSAWCVVSAANTGNGTQTKPSERVTSRMHRAEQSSPFFKRGAVETPCGYQGGGGA